MGNVTGETAMRVTGSSNDVTFTGQGSIVDLELQYNSAGDVIVTQRFDCCWNGRFNDRKNN